MVVLAGGNHIRYGFGIPRRVFRRLPVSYVLIGSEEIAVQEGKTPQTMDVTMPLFPMPPYDFVAFTVYEELPERVKLGVRMEEQDGKVVVLSVIPGSTADQGGIRAGDILRTINGEIITENFDLIYAIGQRKKGDLGIVEVERDGESLKLPVEFQPLPPGDPHR
jgi:predicted metalloprotease with PDZ domain